MIKELSNEVLKKYSFQQSDAGRQALNASERMKKAYMELLNIPSNAFSIGKLIPCINKKTGCIDKFCEED